MLITYVLSQNDDETHVNVLIVSVEGNLLKTVAGTCFCDVRNCKRKHLVLFKMLVVNACYKKNVHMLFPKSMCLKTNVYFHFSPPQHLELHSDTNL